MRIEAQTTLQNVTLLLAQRGAQVVSGLFFAVLVPRLMGPDSYGQYSLVTSLCIWFVFASGLGFTQVIGHYVPLFLLKSDGDRLQTFFQNLLMVRLPSGFAATGLYLLLTRLWLQDIDPLVLILVVGIVFARAVTDLLFAFFIGLNQAARWGMRQVVRGWTSLLLVIIGFCWAGLRGAVLGLLSSELIVLLVAIRWSRGHLSWSCLRWRPRQTTPCLRFGLVFFAGGSLLLIVSPSTLDHFPDPTDLGCSLRELHRVLEPAGQLIITLDNRQNVLDFLLRLVVRLSWVRYYVGRSYRVGALRQELEAASLRVHETTAILHNPRLMAVAAVTLANALGWRPFTTLVHRVPTAAQRLETTRWRNRTGSFVAAGATRAIESTKAGR